MLKKINVFFVLVILGLILSKPVAAEATVDDFQVWGNVTALGNFGFLNPQKPELKRFRWWAEGQGRFGNDASQFTQSLIRPGVGYAITDKIVVWAGYAWAPTAEPIAGRGSFNEHRLWQQVTWGDSFSFGRLSTRTRFEQRFFDHRVPDPGPNDVAYRFRQLVKLAVPMSFISPNLDFVLANELFIAMNTPQEGWITRGFDQNRGFVGLGYKVNKNATVEMGYMNQLINRAHNARPDQMMHNLIVTLLLNF